MSNPALDWARASRGLTPTQKLVLLIMADAANKKTNVCTLSAGTIAADAGLTDRAVRDAQHDLLDAGAITGRMGSGIKPHWLLMLAETGTTFLTKRKGIPVSKRKHVPSNRKRVPAKPEPHSSKPEPCSDEPSRTLLEPSGKPGADTAKAELPRDPKSELFRTGLSDLAVMLRIPEQEARKRLGKLLAAAGDDARAVLEAVQRAKEKRPADAFPWLVAALKSRQAQQRRSPPEAEALPAEVNGFIVPAVVNGILDELDVGDMRFRDIQSVVVALLREGHRPDDLYAAASTLRRRGAVEEMRSAMYFGSAVRNRARERREQGPGARFNLDATA